MVDTWKWNEWNGFFSQHVYLLSRGTNNYFHGNWQNLEPPLQITRAFKNTSALPQLVIVLYEWLLLQIISFHRAKVATTKM